MDWSEWLLLIVSAVAVALVPVLIVALCVDCSAQHACERRGGRVERYNYRIVYVPMSCGSGCTMIVPMQNSDWRCIEPLEAR